MSPTYWVPEEAPSSGRTGILLANLGTPDDPTPASLRRYLREFLSDPRVVEAPRWLWWLILNLAVLPFRPRRSAALYRSIWTAEGSPLLVTTLRQAAALQRRLNDLGAAHVAVEVGMRYGRPSIAGALRRLAAAGCTRLLVLPLYPQYSGSTTGSTFDAVAQELCRWRAVPELRTVRSYATDPGYLDALAASIREHWQLHGRGQRLLVSFHGIPVRYAEAGDPYPAECRATAAALAERLELREGEWQLTFQSRFGREPWLEPYTDETLRAWGRSGLGPVDTVCPGFAADCLETLEEMAITNREIFEQAGGTEYRYIPALNDRPDHIEALGRLAVEQLAGWPTYSPHIVAKDGTRRPGP